MAQQINLFNPALIRQKEYLDASMMVMAPGALALLMLGMYAYGHYQLRPLVAEGERTTQERQALQTRLNLTTSQYTQRNTAKVLQDEITATEKKLQAHENILQALGVTPTGEGQGFAVYLRAFARQHMDGIWLRGLEINDADKVMVIRGRALQAELVPQYIIRLGLDPTFKGRTFATLDISAQKAVATPKPTVAVSQLPAADASTPDEPEALPTYVEFTLQSSTSDDKAALAATGARS
jgi:hypothetical protein